MLLMLCLLSSSVAWAQAGVNASFGLKHGEEGLYQLDFRIGDMAFSEDENGFVVLTSDGMVNLAPGEGMPELPQMSRLLSLPRGAELRMERWQQGETRELQLPMGKVLAPWRGAAVKDNELQSPTPDKATYATDSLMCWGEPLEIENLGAMGERQLYRITVHPMAYNPVVGKLVVNSHISATLLTDYYETPTAISPLPRRYLIVSRPQFREGLQPFVKWKRQEGYLVEELYADTSKRDEVKAMIENAFGNGLTTPWPSYMLIVGDAAQIQAYIGTSRPSGLGTHPTDLYYAEHTGDYLPDVMMGRWPVNDTAELRTVVEKTLRYERGEELDIAALHRVLLVAGAENQNPAPITTNGQVNYLKREIKQVDPLVDTICYYNPASSGQRDSILANIGNGVGLLNYTAHCTTAGWSNPAVSYGSIDTLGEEMPMVYVNNCCQSNNFTGTCFGEQLLRKPQGGGVAVIGATNSTLWDEDFYWSVGPKHPFSIEPQYDSMRPGAFDRWLGQEALTAGELLVAGNIAVSAFGSPYDRFYWEIYTLFGDPSLAPWFGMPQTVQLHVPDTIAVGTMELRVSGTPGAMVSAMQGDELLGVVLLDEHSSSMLQLSRPTDTMPVLFTASKPRMLPVELTIPSAMPQGKAVAFTDVSLGEGQVGLTIVNLGTDTLYGLSVALTTADSGSMYASFTAGTALFDTMAPQAAHAMNLTFHIDRWAPILAAMLAATDTDGDSWHLSLGIALDDMLPELYFNIRSADTTFVTTLERNNDYLVGATPLSYYDTLHLGVTTLPDSCTVEGDGQWMPVAIGDSTTHLRLVAYIGRGNYSRSYEYYLNVGGSNDGFGNGMQSYPWQSGGTQPWIVDNSVSHSGSYSLRSGAIDYRQTSDLTLQFELPAEDSISFWLRTSTELDYDRLIFTVDDVKYFEASGDNGWRRYAYQLMAGRHILRWRYVKDESTSVGSDCVWLDDVRLPLALWDAPYGGTAADDMAGITSAAVSNGCLLLYPNPSNGQVVVAADGLRIDNLRVSDLYGRVVYTADYNHVESPLTLTLPLPDGIYYVKLRTDGGTFHSKLIIIHL